MTEHASDGAYPRARRTQSLVDIGFSVVIAMLIWPFPVARAMLTVPVHVAGVLVACVIAQLLYYAISAVAWRQTLGMRLADLHLGSSDGDSPTRVQALKWGLLSAFIASWFAFAPSSACTASFAERLSHTTVY